MNFESSTSTPAPSSRCLKDPTSATKPAMQLQQPSRRSSLHTCNHPAQQERSAKRFLFPWSQPQQQRSTRKSVRFSADSTMMHVHLPSAREVSIRWYTKEEKELFQRILYLEASRQSKVYLASKKQNPPAVLPSEELVKCVGLVHLLSEDVRARYREYKQNRLIHAYTVLQEQERQRKIGENCEKMLAKVAKASSRRARERAFKVAHLSTETRPHRRASC